MVQLNCGLPFRACLLGGAIGDALGAPVEFLSRRDIVARFGANGITEYAPAFGRLGAITDDTQMTLFTAEGALRAYVRANTRGICHSPSVIHYAYLRWLRTQADDAEAAKDEYADGWLITHRELFARRAPGLTCLSALNVSRERLGSPAVNDSKGCGGVMRVAPIGMLYRSMANRNPRGADRGRKEAFSLACDAAALTHGHPTGFLSAGAFAVLVFELLGGASLVEGVNAAQNLLAEREHHEETAHALAHALVLAKDDTPADEALSKLGQGWVAEEALAIAVFCAARARDFDSGIIMAVNHDGDSDSTGSMTGQLLGAMLGMSAIADRWLASLELRDAIETIADDLYHCAAWRLDDYNDSEAAAESERICKRYPGG